MLLRASVLEGLPGFNDSCNKTQIVKENLIREVTISEKIRKIQPQKIKEKNLEKEIIECPACLSAGTEF